MGTEIPKSDIAQTKVTPPPRKGPEVVEAQAITPIAAEIKAESASNRLTALHDTEKLPENAVGLPEARINEAWISNSRAVTV